MRIVVSRLLALMAAILAHASAFAEVLESGADDFLTKPFTQQGLLASVRKHLQRSS